MSLGASDDVQKGWANYVQAQMQGFLVKRPEKYESNRFKEIEDLFTYWKDVPEQTPIVDSILFLASKIKETNYSLNCLDSYVTGYDP